MNRRWRTLGAALLVWSVVVGQATSRAARTAPAGPPRLPDLLSRTGLYAGDGTSQVDPRNRPFSPQYALWSDGAEKRRWVRLPQGATIEAGDVNAWDFPVGTRFWKEFAFAGRKVETRLLWRAADGWAFGSYVWNEAQTEAVLAPDGGVPRLIEIAPGRHHSIPSTADCRACHDAGRTQILGFSALQLSTDRDPLAIHSESLTPEMVTLRTLIVEGTLRPTRREWLTDPPRIRAENPRARAALGYLAVNCGGCHNRNSPLAPLGLFLDQPAEASDREADAAVGEMIGRPGKWLVPGAPAGASAWITPGHPDMSAILYRMRSRRPSSQMPPLGTVLPDDEAVDLVSAWIAEDLRAHGSGTRDARGSGVLLPR